MALPPFFIPPLEIVLHQSCVQTPVLHLFPSAGVDGVSCIVQTDFLLQSSYWMAFLLKKLVHEKTCLVMTKRVNFSGQLVAFANLIQLLPPLVP